LLLAPAPARLQQRALDPATARALRDGGQVILMRLALTTPGVGDPPGYTLADCRTQRNLSGEGIQAALSQHALLLRGGIFIERALASPWCRTMDTARLVSGRTPEAYAALESFFDESHQAARERVTSRVLQTLLAWRGGGAARGAGTPSGNLLMVSHGLNLGALVGRVPGFGEGIVVHPRRPRGAALQVVGHLAP
jgi:broad specificity phosphatase PhoE